MARLLCVIFALAACGPAEPPPDHFGITTPNPAYLGDATVPTELPYNCFALYRSPSDVIFYCEVLQNSQPGDPAPRNVGDPFVGQ